ncbi:hypothetical protein QWE_18343 [Agrobacterium albertimagni AOL15]|uniref:Uncharacterized protein n=1 Tax=Agrobacterium albertimagni AOL15 TaxID=1156935 RepID=K2QTY8_9HYPH|nr:hypothetical protein [Agrobacterium albertimagni]EKF58587.1 hypothetical protein QWE_18343 [Agrobacterium albertimagni AOL15]
MPPLTPYSRSYSFTDYQASNPSAPLPGIQVDSELENVEQSIGGIVNAINDVRRSDGKLKNAIVTIDSLSPQVAAGVGAGALASAEAAAASELAAAASEAAAASSASAAAGSAANASDALEDTEIAQAQADTARVAAQTARDYAYQWSSAASGVDVNDGVNPVNKSAYHWAQVALAAAAGSIADGSVTTAKLADNSVTSAKIVNGTIATADLADGAVATAKIADESVTTAKLASSIAVVRFDAVQSRTLTERGQALANIGGGVLAGFRNKLINGAAQIIQRGGRTIAAGASAYVFDRFLVTNNTNQTVTVSQVAFALGSGFAREARNAMRFSFTTAPTTGTLRIEQRIEFVDSIRATDHTFIAWMSGPSGSEALAAEFIQNFGTGGSPSTQVVTPMTFAGSSPTTIFSASTNRRAWGVTVPSLSGKFLGINGNDFAAAAIVMTPRQAGNYDLTWLSFVEGNATSEEDPFAPRDRGHEIALCQRFFEKSYSLTVPPGTATTNGQEAAVSPAGGIGAMRFSPRFKVQKRSANPTVVLYSPFNGSQGFIYDGPALTNRAASVDITSDGAFSCVNNVTTTSGATHSVQWATDVEL